MKKMVLTKGIVLSLLLSFPLMAGASDQGHAVPEHNAPAVHETNGHAAPAEHMAVTGHEAPAEEHAAPAHGADAGHAAPADAHGGGHEAAAGDHGGGHGGGHHGPILSGVTDPIGTGFLTYIIIMTLFIIPIAVHNENKKHAHGHGGHDDAHGDGHDDGGHGDAHHGDSGHGEASHDSH